MASHKHLREIIPPGTHVEFVGRTRIWALISALLILGSIATVFINKSQRGDYLNWSFDFKGGTELIFKFNDAEGKSTDVPIDEIRTALSDAGYDGSEISDISWSEEDTTIQGIMVRTPSFGMSEDPRAKDIAADLKKEFADSGVIVARWRNDDLFIRSKQPLDEAKLKAFFAKYELQMKPWSEEQRREYTTAPEGREEIKAKASVWGLDRQLIELFQSKISGVKVELVQSHGVSAKAGKRLQNDGLRALFYSIALIMLYLAFRFDIRYAPGAVVALFHDAILVVGVFALTWTEVSLTSLAALLTVIGYSVNDTVVIFDRIRENVAKLKDKRLSRIINISLNETLSRTLLTSLTLFVVTLMMNILGTGMVRNFAFAMNIGVVVGVYSSVFVASPVLLWIDDRYYGGAARRKRAANK